MKINTYYLYWFPDFDLITFNLAAVVMDITNSNIKKATRPQTSVESCLCTGGDRPLNIISVVLKLFKPTFGFVW